MKPSVHNEPSFLVVTDHPSLFHPLLQRGFLVGIREGCTLRDLLEKRLGLSPDSVEEELGTIFLDGRPVDDLDATRLKDGSRLALSAAMPGLVGAALRRGGFYAAFRSDISHREEDPVPGIREAVVWVKLFNLVARTQGPRVLEKGILLERNHLREFLEDHTGDFRAHCRSVRVNGRETDPDGMLAAAGSPGSDRVRLRVLS
ncbi:MAG TPA: hypothetical protein PLM79_16200 [Syntrophobacteraceae bacterium]|nr:hypothetical protein [Syntrophobacteraceae bacterium]